MKFDLRNGLWNGTIGASLVFVVSFSAWMAGINPKPITLTGLMWATLVGFTFLTIGGAIVGNFENNPDDE
jgi:ABC-type multidrug transport system permease subunit